MICMTSMKKPNQNKLTCGELPKSYLIYNLNQYEKIRYFVLCGLALTGISYLFYHSVVLALIASFASVFFIQPYKHYLAEKRRKELKGQFRDVLYSISASLSTGHQMAEALSEAADNLSLIYSKDSLIVMELSLMAKRMNEYRESEEEILKDFASRAAIDDITDFVDIYLTCRKTGGDLIKVLTKASEIITDKITVEKEIQTLTAQKRFEAKILTAIPIFIIFALQLLSPGYLAVMYEGIAGRVLMTLALAGIAASYFISNQLTKIEV